MGPVISRSTLCVAVVALLASLLIMTGPSSAGAGTPAGCMAPAEAVAWSSAVDTAMTVLPDGTLVIAESRIVDVDEEVFETTLSIGAEEVVIPSVVGRVVASDDGSVWIVTDGVDTGGFLLSSGIGIYRWSPIAGLQPVPGTTEWDVIDVHDDGRALMTDRLGSYRWVAPDGTDEAIPLSPDADRTQLNAHFSLAYTFADELEGRDTVILRVGDRQRDVSAEFDGRRGLMTVGDQPVILKDETVIVLGIDETIVFPIDDPTRSLRLVGETSNSLFLARRGPVAAEVYALDRVTGAVTSLGFGPEGSWVTVVSDNDIWLWPVLERRNGDLFENEIQRLQPLPYDPAFVGQAERSGRIERLYRAFFQRQPDTPGLDFWRSSTDRATDIADAFAASPEFIETYGILGLEGFVDLVYNNVLGRAPDDAGRDYWVGQLRSGWSRGEVMLNFSESPEFVQQTGTDAPTRALDGTIERLYRAYFDRSPDQGGLCFWTDQVLVQGRTVADLSAEFEHSPEFTDLYGALDDEAFVGLVYRNVLGRGPDAVGAAFWLDALGSGLTRSDLMLQFAESREFKVATDTL